jgi:hypothetical protein
MDAAESLEIFTGEIPTQLSLEQVHIKAITTLLHRASKTLKSSDFNTMVLNLELLGFGLLWYGMVSCLMKPIWFILISV